MTLEPMTAPELPVLTPRVPEPPVEVCFASRLTEWTPRTALAANLFAIRERAIREGMQLMSFEEICADVEARRIGAEE